MRKTAEIQTKKLKKQFKITQLIDPTDGNFLKAIYPLPNTDKIHVIILERMQSEGVPDVACVSEGYRWQDEVTLKFKYKNNKSCKNYSGVYIVCL